MLTVLMPTRNRASYCARQLRFLRDNSFRHRILVLDASEPAIADSVRSACDGIAEYRHFASEFRMADKLAAAVGDVTTPYVVLIPDDDVVLPDAIADAMSFLDGHPDFVVAHGYFVEFRIKGVDFDFYKVAGFTPSIVDDEPLRRHFNLMRRYQSFYWGVFRTKIFSSAVRAATAMQAVLFRELTAMSVTILQGKVARLPVVYALHGEVTSHAALHQSHPLFFFLRDAAGFFGGYQVFRDGIAAFIRRAGITVPAGTPIEQILDLIYGTYLGREIDPGKMNHMVEMVLGDALPPIESSPQTRWQEPRGGDLVHRSSSGGRRYIWRRSVIEAEPREEIVLSAANMTRAERQLDAYR